MKKYRRLATWTLKVLPKSEKHFEELGEVILTSNVGNPFLHWYSAKGNLSATATLDGYILVHTPVRIVNNTESIILVDIIEI
jgi:hypothetical protein